MAIHKLIDLDFSPGIKAEFINFNFQLVYDWLRRERLRLGGWGIVEGFDLAYDAESLTVTVGEGVLINQDGDEVIIPEHTFSTGEMDFLRVTRTYTADSEGKIILDDCVYDPTNHHFVTYNPPDKIQTYNDYIIDITDEEGFNVPLVRLIGKYLWVNQSYAGQQLTVTQVITADRVDTIMLHKDGTYEYLWSIDSTSPSHVDLADYDDTFCIAVVYWQITDGGITCDFFTNHRSYRRIYVDKNNVLYINGEIYKKQKFIYFEEPAESDREENDLWYNVKDNTLYIWRQVDGEWGWVIVNDHSEIIVKERKIWEPLNNPEDYQTFRFEDEEVNLRFVPGTNALDILIDNAPLMDDQYVELSMTEAEANDIKEQIDSLTLEINNQQLELELLQIDYDKINSTIQVLRKDLRDSKTLYPAAYDVDNNTYTVSDNDITNLRNLMIVDQRVTQAVEELHDLLKQIQKKEELISLRKEELSVMQGLYAGNYIDRGIGFKLKRPLSHAAYVEVTVTHQVRMKPARETFQRCSIFIRENDITVTEDGAGQSFRTMSGYSLGNEQLEVFVNGTRLSKGLDEFREQIDHEKEEKPAELQDYDYNDPDIKEKYAGMTSYHFKIMENLVEGQNITYRISKQVWSYDQLDTIVSNIRDYARNAFDTAKKVLADVTEFQDNVSSVLADIRNEVSIIKAETEKISRCYVQGEDILFSDIPSEVKTDLLGSLINIVKPAVSIEVAFDGILIEKDQDGIIVNGDIFEIHYVTPDFSRILIREGKDRNLQDIDYWITTYNSEGITITLRDDLVSEDAILYMTGFKRGVL